MQSVVQTTVNTEVSLASSPSAGATSFLLDVVPDGLAVGSVVAIDAYTTQCELRAVTSLSAQTVGVAATRYAHTSGDSLVVLNDSQATPPMFGMTDLTADNWEPMQRLVLEALDTNVTVSFRAAVIGNVWSVSKPICAPTSTQWDNVGLKTHASYAPADPAGALCMVSNASYAFTADGATNVFTVIGGHSTGGPGGYSETNHVKIVFNNPYGETLPSGITAGKVYYFDTCPTTSTFTVSATKGGATLDIGTGTGWAFDGVDELSRTYWDNVRFEVTVADVNGLRCSLQQPCHITNLRIRLGANCTVRTYGMWVIGQLATILNTEIDPSGNNTTGLFLGGSGIAFTNLNMVGNNTSDNYGVETACWAGTITNLWTESVGIGLKLTGECRGLAIDGSWLFASGAPTQIAIQVDTAAKDSSYRVCPLRWANGASNHVLHDIGRVVDLWTAGYATDPSLVSTDLQGTFGGLTQEGQNSGDNGYNPPTLLQRSLVAVSSNYTARYIDNIVYVDSTGAGRTITLPTAVGWRGHDITIGHYAGSNTCVIDPAGSETIDGSATYTLPAAAVVTCVSDGANWRVLAVGLPGQVQTYTTTNVTPDRSFDANAVLIAELADVVGTLIADLQTRKVIG